MKELLLTKLRDKNTGMAEFRWTAQQLAHILASETASILPKVKLPITTPLGNFDGVTLRYSVVLVPILRSGLALLPSFIEFFPNATVGCIGLKRDEVTAEAHLYYKNLPPIGKEDRIIILDPMIATGGSGTAAIKILLEHNIEEERITYAAVIAAKEGLSKINKAFPKIKIIVPAVDEKLNTHEFIVPGLGDFGDRYFGTL